jgi:uncharacterized membrane protein YphA (DoxX/SURF4 family)
MKWKITDWLLRSLIALAFIAASLGKLTSTPGVLERFATYGFPRGFHLLIGIVELVGAILVLVPKSRLFGIYILTAVVAGAAATHLVHDPLIQLVRPLVFALFLAAAWLVTKKLDTCSEVE